MKLRQLDPRPQTITTVGWFGVARLPAERMWILFCRPLASGGSAMYDDRTVLSYVLSSMIVGFVGRKDVLGLVFLLSGMWESRRNCDVCRSGS